MNRGPWPQHKNRSGYSIITVKGTRYRIKGTGLSYAMLLKVVKNGGSNVKTLDPAERVEE